MINRKQYKMTNFLILINRHMLRDDLVERKDENHYNENDAYFIMPIVLIN